MGIWNYMNLIILLVQATIILLGTFYKHISFGWGLGDMIWYLIVYGLFFTHLYLTFTGRKKGSKEFMRLTILFAITTVFISLCATIWRGALYPWNGEIFYN